MSVKKIEQKEKMIIIKSKVSNIVPRKDFKTATISSIQIWNHLKTDTSVHKGFQTVGLLDNIEMSLTKMHHFIQCEKKIIYRILTH